MKKTNDSCQADQVAPEVVEFNPTDWHPDGDPFLHSGLHAVRLSQSPNGLCRELAEQLGGALNELRNAGSDVERVAKAAFWVGLLSGYLSEEESYPSIEKFKASKSLVRQYTQRIALRERNNNDKVIRARAVRSFAEEYAQGLLTEDYFGGPRKLRRATLAKKVYDYLEKPAFIQYRPSIRTINEKWLAALAKTFDYISEPGAPKTPEHK